MALLRDGEEVTVKRFSTEGNEARLTPENRELALPAEDVRVQSSVVYVVHPPGGRGA